MHFLYVAKIYLLTLLKISYKVGIGLIVAISIMALIAYLKEDKAIFTKGYRKLRRYLMWNLLLLRIKGGEIVMSNNFENEVLKRLANIEDLMLFRYKNENSLLVKQEAKFKFRRFIWQKIAEH